MGGPHAHPETIPAALRRAATAYGAEEAVVERGRRVSFAELAGLVDDAARALVATGVQPGDRVAIWAPNSLEWMVASFSVYAAGGVLVPLNTRFKGEEAGHVLRTSGARVLLGTTDLLGTDLLALIEAVPGLDALDRTVVLHGPARAGAVTWEQLLGRGGAVDAATVRAREEAVRPEDPSDIIFTSGTTGRPKGAVLTHGASVRTYLAWSELVGLRRGDRYLSVYPFFHTSGLKSVILTCLLSGATLRPHAVFDVSAVMADVARERVTVLPGPPTVFQSILEHPDLASFDLSSLRLSVTGAAIVPVEVVRRMRAELRFETVVTGYGLTETTGTVSMCRHDDPPEVVAHTVGRPLPGVEVTIDGTGADGTGAGGTGEILVRGFNVMKEYFADPEATAEAVDADGWLRTGDIGFVDDDGNLRITDRKKDMFIVGGFNAYPAEIEGIMLQHPAVAQVAVIGVADHRLGEVGAAFVIPRAGADVAEEELVAWCRDHMANYKVPRTVRLVDSFPLTPSGKVMKYVLREQAL
ncbi:MAG TPA: FadD3 family acyl-CoA ligase [Acidimicrobiales bacterium]|nr:FadD3 family acyl-CoA ligase [Acidimicrobiales bacterium]